MRVVVWATALLLVGCGGETTPSGPITYDIDCSRTNAVEDPVPWIQCNNEGDVIEEGSGGRGAGGSSQASVYASPCHWAYNGFDPGFAECIPVLVHGKELKELAVTVDPPNAGYKPAGPSPTLAMFRRSMFFEGDPWVTVDQKPDASKSTAEWEAPHQISIFPAEVVSLDLFEYRLVFDPYEALPYNDSILKTTAVYQP